MRRYVFRFEKLLELRRKRRAELRERVAEAQRAVDIVNGELRTLDGEFQEIRRHARVLFSEGKFDVNRALELSRYEQMIQAAKVDLLAKLKLLEQELANRQSVLVDAEREVKALELLDERRRAQHLREERKAEVKRLDEMANLAAARRAQRGAL